METQHKKIIGLCSDGEFHCQNEFRALYIFSPHKRRAEIEEGGKWKFEKRKCQHGVRGQFDYRMYQDPTYIEPRKMTDEERELQLLREATQ